MSLIADTHVHLYPCYDLDHAFRRLSSNLSRLAAGYNTESSLVAVLTERHDCHFFSQLRDGTRRPLSPSITIEASAEPDCVKICWDGTEFYLFSGRQVITLERIEILALTVNVDIPDGLLANDIVTRIDDEGGLPVLSWAPGKWFAGRGAIVRELFRRAEPGTLLAGDTTLRPVGWATPVLMRAASRQGLRVIAGSDPLPFAGEEHYMGTYASYIDAAFDVDAPVTSLRRTLSGDRESEQAGRRCQLFPWMLRLWRNMRTKQRN